MPTTVRSRLTAIAAVMLLVLGACSDAQPADETEAETSTTTPAPTATTQAPAPSSTSTTTVPETTTTTPKPPAIEVVASDYFFEGIPENAPVGTRLSLFNNSSAEFHEMVIFKVHDAEQRSVEELSKLSFDQLYSFDVGVLQSVVFAMPESEQYTNVEGPPVLAEEGRYLIFCAINVGTDPIEARNATARGPVHSIEGVPRHYEVGMVAEVIATG